MQDDDNEHETLDDSLLREIAAAPPIAIPQDFATFVLLEPGTVVDGAFQIESRLGAGGMGVVYAARDLKLDREVALKLMRLDRGHLGDKLPDVFEREARATARLNHPNVVTLHQFGNWNGLLYLVLERLRGETLHARIERSGVTLAEGLAIVEQVARALVHTHAAGITHRDLKPQNVFLLAAGGVKVLDFGVSGLGRMAEVAPPAGIARARSTLSLAGTPGYMAPEQWSGAAQGPRTDVFAIGVMLYQLVGGELPFGAGPISTSAIAPSLAGRVPAEAADLVPLVAACLAGSPDERLGSASELVDRIHAIRRSLGELAGGTVHGDRKPLATAWLRRPRRRMLAIAAALGVAGTAMAIAIVGPRSGGAACDVGTRATAIWNDRVRARLGEHFQHSATWDAIGRAIDTYVAQWVPLREAACRAKHVAAQACLDQRLDAVARLVVGLPAIKPEPALTTARGLPALADCSDPDYLASLANPERPAPRDPRALVPSSLTVAGRGRDIVHAATFVDGELVVSGFASPDATIAGTAIVGPPEDDRYGFVARIGRDGAARWITVLTYGGPLALATSGDRVVVAGRYAATAKLGDHAFAAPEHAKDGMVAALDATTGKVRWVRTLGASAPSMVRGLASDRDGNLYAVGDYGGTATFGGTATHDAGKTTELAPFIASWTSDGRLRWVRTARGNAGSKTWGVAVDDRALVFASSIRGAGKLGDHVVGEAGGCVIGRLARETGAVVWLHHERGEAGRCSVDAIALRDGRLAASGRHYVAAMSAWIAELSLDDGSWRWVTQLGSAEMDTVKALAFAPDGTLAAAGHFTTESLLVGNQTLVSNGVWDAFVVTLDRDGKPRASVGLGGATSDLIRWVSYGPEGQLLVGGRFETAMRVGDRTLRGVGSMDGFVLEVSPALFDRAIRAAPSRPAASASP